MSRQDLIDAMAEAAEIKKTEADSALRAFEAAVTASLKKGDNVALVGFGTFKARKRKARTGKNPRTGATVNIPAKTVPAFTAGKKLKEALNSGAKKK